MIEQRRTNIFYEPITYYFSLFRWHDSIELLNLIKHFTVKACMQLLPINKVANFHLECVRIWYPWPLQIITIFPFFFIVLIWFLHYGKGFFFVCSNSQVDLSVWKSGASSNRRQRFLNFWYYTDWRIREGVMKAFFVVANSTRISCFLWYIDNFSPVDTVNTKYWTKQ